MTLLQQESKQGTNCENGEKLNEILILLNINTVLTVF